MFSSSQKPPVRARYTQNPQRAAMARFLVFKMINDSGIAPCVTPPTKSYWALLSFALCKPAIRRSASIGDYVIGLSSKSIAKTDDYPLDSIIFCAKVDRKLRGEYYYPRDGQADTSEYRCQIDRIYPYNEASGRYSMIPNQTGHTESNMSKDIGEYSSDKEHSYKNSWVLLSSDFRYVGKSAHKIPETCPGFLRHAKRMTQGHRVYKDTDPVWHELKDLLEDLFQRETCYTQDAAARKRARCSSGIRGDGESNTRVVKRAKNRC